MNKINNNVKILLWDIETLPILTFTWGMWQQNISSSQIVKDTSIICISYKWLNESNVHTISIGEFPREFKADPYICGKYVAEKFIPILQQADFAVAHNGDKFDYKHLKAHAIMHGLPAFKVRTVDTLKMAKATGLFPRGNRLDNIAKVLGITGKNKTSMKLWTDIALKSSHSALQTMERYCEQDVMVLEEVFLKLWPHAENILPSIHVLTGGTKDTTACNRCASTNYIKNGRYIKNVLVYQRYVCKNCGAEFIGRTPIETEKK